jgi:dipeptidase E
MRVLLGSGGLRTPERVAFIAQQMRAFFGRVKRILFVPYAGSDHEKYVKLMRQRGLHAGYRLEGIHRASDPVAAVHKAQAIYVGGGNTFRLLAELYRFGLLDVIRDRVRHGLPYLGVSAGTNVACPAIKTTNDMPIVQPPSLDALGLVPFQVNPHYFTGQTFVKDDDDGYHEHFGETRDDRLREFHEMNTTPVVGLWEGGTLWVEDGKVTLDGAAARVFRKGQPAVDVEPGADLAGLLPPVGPPVAYTVAVTFTDPNLAGPWLAWLRGGHLAAVLAGGAEHAEVVELDVSKGRAFEVRYRFASRQALEAYERDRAPALRAEGLRLFPVEKGVSYRRSTGDIVPG